MMEVRKLCMYALLSLCAAWSFLLWLWTLMLSILFFPIYDLVCAWTTAADVCNIWQNALHVELDLNNFAVSHICYSDKEFNFVPAHLLKHEKANCLDICNLHPVHLSWLSLFSCHVLHFLFATLPPVAHSGIDVYAAVEPFSELSKLCSCLN